ncbi:MAG TPA: glutamate-1-semialdehyde 2,1-aminomutase [Steroidobacteraceae bacterium]|nr:glutamate-1-semialdehyde 2,1-aminomutase [Steroidobacteraceae bacterium]HVY81751.1 glutamate-1-semialdehyde 2,1-aminomutase [Steroidobacteraceae bacterium]
MRAPRGNPVPAEAPTQSIALFDRAEKVIPGGVNSPVRAFYAVGGVPRFIVRGAGSQLYDADGRRYLDLVNSWGALILGHAHPEVVKAIVESSALGTTFGAPCPAEVELAERVVASYPGLEQVRFVSSGTEAVMSAIRLARAFTGRDLIVKYAGCYHGHADHLLVSAGSGLATFGKPSSAGVPAAFVECTRVLPLDDEKALEQLFQREGSRIAAVVIEPIPANHGLLPQRPEYLRALREITRKHGALLIFDEVISGFRVARGGVAQLSGITPDLATFGKIIGGGMPVGAFGGLRQIMARLAPEGDTYQAGTLSGNPVAMSAGIAALDVLVRDQGWEKLEALGAALERMLQPVLAKAKFPVRFVRAGSLFWLALHEGPAPRAAVTLSELDTERYASIFHAMLARGIYLPPSAYEVCFLSLAHTTADMERFTTALAESLELTAQRVK